MNDIKWDSLKVLTQKKQQYEPDQEEILQYAQYLGVELPDDIDLLPIVREGLTVSLPQQWQPCHTLQGQLVYRNIKTKQIQEQHPLDQVYRKKISNLKKLRMPLAVIEEEDRNQSKFQQNLSKYSEARSKQQKEQLHFMDKSISQCNSQMQIQKEEIRQVNTLEGVMNEGNKLTYLQFLTFKQEKDKQKQKHQQNKDKNKDKNNDKNKDKNKEKISQIKQQIQFKKLILANLQYQNMCQINQIKQVVQMKKNKIKSSLKDQ